LAARGGAAAGFYGGHTAGQWLDEALGRPCGIPTGFIPLGQIPVSPMLLGLLLGWAGAGRTSLRFAGGGREPAGRDSGVQLYVRTVA